MFKRSSLFVYTFSFLVGLSLSGGWIALADHRDAADEDSDQVPLVEPGILHSETLPECQGVIHEHFFRNISENEPDVEFRAAVYAFAIELGDDFWEHVDTEEMQCSNGDRDGTFTVDCRFDKDTVREGDVIYSGPERNGTKITYDRLDWIPGSPRGLIWEYGQNALAADGSYDDPEELTLLPWLDPPGYDTPGVDEFKRESLWFDLEDGDAGDLAIDTKSWTKVEMFRNDPRDDTGTATVDILAYENVYPIDVDFNQNGILDGRDVQVDPDGDYIFWHGLNGIERTVWPSCTPPPIEEEVPLCANLDWDVTRVDVNDLFQDLHLTATVTDTTGADISNDTRLTFKYEAWAFGTPLTAPPDAIGHFNRGDHDIEIDNNEVNYKNSQPGDTIRVQVVGAGPECSAILEFPYCENADFVRPSSSVVQRDGETFEQDLEVVATASDGSPWPFDLVYDSLDNNSTFDGRSPALTTTDKTVHYSSQRSSTVSVEALNDVANVCSDQFTYTLVPPVEEVVCENLEITSYEREIPLDDMLDGNVEITWETTLSDGSDSTGPWTVISSNPNGEFRGTRGGPVLARGTLFNTRLTTLFYTGEPGDTIHVQENTAPTQCFDDLISVPQEPDQPFCEDLTLTDTPDISTNEALSALYADGTTCFDYRVEVSENTWDGTLVITGFEDDSTAARTNGTLQVQGESTAGNPVTLPLNPGQTEYTGTVCYENFEENNVLDFTVLGESACEAEFEFPPLTPSPEEPVCEGLELDPNGVWTIDPEDNDAGLIELDVDIESERDWEGTLVVQPQGECQLTYAGGGSPFFGDGRLEFPVSDSLDHVEFRADNCEDGDEIEAFVRNEDDVCSDDLRFEQDDEEDFACEDLSIDPQGSTIFSGRQSRPLDLEIEIESESRDWEGTLIVEASGDCELSYEDDEEEDELEIDVDGSNTTVEVTVDNCEDDDEVKAYIQGDSRACSDEIDFSVREVDPVCEDPSLNINPETPTLVIEGGEVIADVDMECDCLEPGRTVVVTYTGCNGTIGYQGASYNDRLEVDSGTNLNDIEFENVCENATIEVYVEGYEDICSDTLRPQVLKMGEFDKHIFTFNFAAEKNSYSDEDTFFSHDEDRAFYTLEYDPAGTEGGITFNDDMWHGNLKGTFGNGQSSGGNIRLAKTKQELIQGKAAGQVYNFKSLVNFGFGSNGYGGTYEEFSQDIAGQIQSRYDGEFSSYIPYIKYPFSAQRQSELILACTFSNGALVSTHVCYDSNHSPERTGDVRIENVSEVERLNPEASIRIRYVGIVDSGLDCSNNQDGCLTEEFENNASVKVYDQVDPLYAKARLVSLCSYLVTRAGDVYLGGSLQGGTDVSCVFDGASDEFRSTDGLLIREEEVLESSDFDLPFGEQIEVEQINLDDLNFCDTEGENSDLFGSLSSYVCEIVVEVSDLWREGSIAGETAGRVNQATRHAETNPAGLTSFSSWDELYAALHNPKNPDSGILYFDGSKNGAVLTLGGFTIPDGAWTLIVENAQLRIVEDIQYARSTNYSNLPSMAFVVLGGDIFVQNTAENLVGVYYTDQSFLGNDRSAVNEPLEILGSVYGDLQPLLDAAKYVGPPTLDGGGIVVRYDSRILINTPPGLSEYVDIQTEQAVN